MNAVVSPVREAARPQIVDVLRQCIERCPDIDGCLVSTVDGHDVEKVVHRPIATERLSTMNCSALALAETLAKESDQGLCRFVILENTDGRIVVLRINRHLLLTCLSTLGSNLGMVLNIGQRTAATLASALKSMPGR